MGAVIGDLNARRGRISKMTTGMEPQLGVQTLAAEVPLSTMFGYSTELRSATQGSSDLYEQRTAGDGVLTLRTGPGTFVRRDRNADGRVGKD